MSKKKRSQTFTTVTLDSLSKLPPLSNDPPVATAESVAAPVPETPLAPAAPPAAVAEVQAAPAIEPPPVVVEKENSNAPPAPEPEPVAKRPSPEPVSEEEILRDAPALALLEMPEPETTPVVETAPPPKPAIPPMFVMMIASEMAPVAKVGGLGDVVYGLARELEIRGNAVEIILPKYNNMRYDHVWGLTKAYDDLWVPWFGGAIHTSVWFGFVHGRKCFFIDPHSADNFFNRGVYYGHNDDVLRFAFFCRAAMEFIHKSGKQPDVIHCHDWQTALVPVLLYEMYQHLGLRHPRVCFTIHNFRHQGVTGEQILHATGLHRPEHFFSYDRMRDNNNPRALNLMKAGIVYSNFVTTVSPRHAWEAKDGGQGDGLGHTLHTHHYKFGGVLNGLDYDYFNPETDKYIPAHYSAATLEKKYENKKALRNRFWLADNEKPIVAFIGRLDQQKGLELVRHAIFYALNNRAQFVLLGNSPERGINDHFLGLKRQLNDSPDCHLEIGYHEELAHLIYAGADLMIVPSRYEPCGLTQLISLRYGTVPVVRSVGGLADTVYDKDYSPRPLHERNGYVFDHANNAGLESALTRAIGCYYHFPDHFRQLILNGMKCDYSWNNPGQHYLNIFDYIRDK
ncbi:MAG: glycogen synthase [Verrucomicrobia bacterium]|nr:MAG: glycogen synthase [Verrucomicrobiota bacterium]